jgi:lipopolysaccharide assembly outer membrane protein LptD (OstA)
MKKTLLSLAAGSLLFSNIAMAYDSGGEWYYEPKKHVKPYLFSVNIGGNYAMNDTDDTFFWDFSLSSHWFDYIDSSWITYGIEGDLGLSFTQMDVYDELEDEEDDETTVYYSRLDIGPTIGYVFSKQFHVWGSVGYSVNYINEEDGNDGFEFAPYVSGNLEYTMNDDWLIYLNYKYKKFDDDNDLGMDPDQHIIGFGVKITYQN